MATVLSRTLAILAAMTAVAVAAATAASSGERESDVPSAPTALDVPRALSAHRGPPSTQPETSTTYTTYTWSRTSSISFTSTKTITTVTLTTTVTATGTTSSSATQTGTDTSTTETGTATVTGTSTATGTNTSTVTFTGTETSTTVTATSTPTATGTSTTVTSSSTRTGTSTATSSTLTATRTTTTTATTTATSTTTETSTHTSSTTTTPFCFEEAVSWEPLNMDGVLPLVISDEFACQRRCLETPGCSHFSFFKLSGQCSLQDRFALKREGSLGYISGPFQCWSYVVHSQFTKLNNNTYLPQRFRCMQVGVSWQPDLEIQSVINGQRDEVVFECRKKCQETEGCEHFTVVFPNACHLAGSDATALPAASSSISGPPGLECSDGEEPSEWGHTFMRKASLRPQGLLPEADASTRAVVILTSFGSCVALAAVAAVIGLRRRAHTHFMRNADEEALLAGAE